MLVHVRHRRAGIEKDANRLNVTGITGHAERGRVVDVHPSVNFKRLARTADQGLDSARVREGDSSVQRSRSALAH